MAKIGLLVSLVGTFSVLFLVGHCEGTPIRMRQREVREEEIREYL